MSNFNNRTVTFGIKTCGLAEAPTITETFPLSKYFSKEKWHSKSQDEKDNMLGLIAMSWVMQFNETLFIELDETN